MFTNFLSMSGMSADIVKALNDNLGIWYTIILNAFGVVAIIFKVSEYQFKTRKFILLFALSASICWVIYFALQGDFVSAIVSLGGTAQYLVYMQRGKYRWADSWLWLVVFLTYQGAFGIITFNKWQDIFAVLAGLFGAVAYFVTNKKLYRTLSLFSLLFWVTNSIFKFYIVAFLNDSFATVSVIIAIIRYDLLKKKNVGKRENKALTTEITE